MTEPKHISLDKIEKFQRTEPNRDFLGADLGTVGLSNNYGNISRNDKNKRVGLLL